MKYAVAVFETGTDVVLSLHILEADSWRHAMNRSPAVWWNTPETMCYEDAQKQALETYRCHVTVKDCAVITR